MSAILAADLEISNDPARIDVSLVHGFLSQSYWASGRSRGVVERSIQNSLCFGAYYQQKQVAFARVITDHATFGYLADVFVIPEFRGRGASKALMRAILDYPGLQDIRLWLRTRDAHGLYAQFGFRPVLKPEDMMTLDKAAGATGARPG